MEIRALGRSIVHGRRDQKQMRALTWRRGRSFRWGMWEPGREGHRWESKDHYWACSLSRGFPLPPWFPEAVLKHSVFTFISVNGPPPGKPPPRLRESPQILSGPHPGCQIQSSVCPFPGPFLEGRGLPLSALVPCSGAPNQRHTMQLCARTPLWQEIGQ